MTFGEKVRAARQEKNYTQKQLATMTGIALRTIQNYESGSRMPKSRETYSILAEALTIDESVLLDDNADFIMQAQEMYGSRAAKQAQKLTGQLTALCAGGDLEQEDLDAMLKAVQDAYWIAKEKNQKYIPKKWRKEPTAPENQ